MISFKRDKMIAYIKECGDKVPAFVKNAKKDDVFAFGSTVLNGRFGSASLHKVGTKFKLTNEITIRPRISK